MLMRCPIALLSLLLLWVGCSNQSTPPPPAQSQDESTAPELCGDELAMEEAPVMATTARYESNFDHATTVKTARQAIETKGFRLFTTVDHAKNINTTGGNLAPNTVLIFGKPTLGAELMGCSPTIAIDLPMKLMIWQDSTQAVQVAYNRPEYLLERHGITGCAAGLIPKMNAALSEVALLASGQ